MPIIAGTTIDPKALQPLPGDNNGRLFVSSEWTQLVRSGRAFGRNQTGAAGAANISFVQLRTTSTVFHLLLYDIIFYVGASTDVVLMLNQGPAGGGVGGINLLMNSPASSAIISGGNVAGGNGGNEIRRWPAVAANTPTRVGLGADFIAEYPGIANVQLGIEAATVNVAISASFLWAEVPSAGYF